ncbi:MAG: DUF1861 family protein [Candidatus Pacebacteria bacterium]|nr:DUF1861 family protein [Candidatus Paceibacterota bacterium]
MIEKYTYIVPDLDLAKKTFTFQNCREAVAKYGESSSRGLGQTLHLDEDQVKLLSILEAQGISLTEGHKVEVYNPSIPFIQNGEEYIAGRVEFSGKEAEHLSTVIFFKYSGEKWIPEESPVFNLQDPNIDIINGSLVLSGVELQAGEKEGDIDYRMAFYTGDDINNLELLTNGPWGMKGIRLIQLENARIGVYTRPQGEKGALGNIGYIEVDSIEEFKNNTEEIIDQAPLLSHRFPNGEWGGVNQAMVLPNSTNLVIGHRAYRDEEDKRHYFPWAFIHDPKTEAITDLGILARRDDFPEGPAKAPDLVDILYSAGIVQRDDKWYLFVGLSDAQTGVIELEKLSDNLDELLDLQSQHIQKS